MIQLSRFWSCVALSVLGMLGHSGFASAQFNPYVMPQFNPVAPVNPVAQPGIPGAATSVSPSYLGPYDPYNSIPYNPYSGIGPYGGALMGLADTYRAYGTLTINYEQARLLREQWTQGKLDTQRKRFDLNAYIKANTPTFTEEQTKIARSTLQRIHSHSTPGEIANGKALNIMLDDARKFPDRKDSKTNIVVSEDVLAQLNVTASFVGLGVLRNDGRISWPLAVLELVPAEQLKTLELQAQVLVQGALKGKIDVNVFRDFSNELDRTYDNLLKRVNEVSGSQYLDAKRFLGDLKDARTALEKGEAKHQVEFQKHIAGGKSVHDVVDYMIKKGLLFAPAAAQDEAAYRAFYSALVAFDVALNTNGPAPAIEKNGSNK